MTVNDVINNFDEIDRKGFDEMQVYSALREITSKDNNDFELKANTIAFFFSENINRTTPNHWNTYFGPMATWSNDNGTMTESPSMHLVTPEILDYWRIRGNKAVNPIIKARYLGLVFDFQKKVKNKDLEIQIVVNYIEALIDIAEGRYCSFDVTNFDKLERALNVSISYNNKKLIERCKNVIISLEKEISEDNKPGLWAPVFDLLIENKKSLLTLEEERGIIAELEKKLSRLTNSKERNIVDPWSVEIAAKKLALYYRRKNHDNDVRRVLLKVVEVFDDYIDTNNSAALLQIGYLERIFKLYDSFKLKEESDEILSRIRDLGPKSAKEMRSVPVSFTFSKNMFGDAVKFILEGSIEDALNKLVYTLIPEKNKLDKLTTETLKKYPLTNLFSINLQDSKGRKKATISSADGENRDHFVFIYSQHLDRTSILLRECIKKAIDNKIISTDIVLEYVSTSPLISENRISIIRRGLNAFFENDLLTFMHLIIPQIEEAIRNIVKTEGGNTLKKAKSGGGFHLKTFDEILRDPIVLQALGEDLTNYYSILFTDSRAWNLRNDVCHGMAEIEVFNFLHADRVLHAFLCLIRYV